MIISRYANNSYWLREIKCHRCCKCQFATVGSVSEIHLDTWSFARIFRWRIHFTSILFFIESSLFSEKCGHIFLSHFLPFSVHIKGKKNVIWIFKLLDRLLGLRSWLFTKKVLLITRKLRIKFRFRTERNRTSVLKNFYNLCVPSFA